MPRFSAAVARGPPGLLTGNPAILYYLSRQIPEKTRGVMDWPTDPIEAARCIEWLAWDASTLHVAFAHISRSERYADSVEGKAEVTKKGVKSCRLLWESVLLMYVLKITLGLNKSLS